MVKDEHRGIIVDEKQMIGKVISELDSDAANTLETPCVERLWESDVIISKLWLLLYGHLDEALKGTSIPVEKSER